MSAHSQTIDRVFSNRNLALGLLATVLLVQGTMAAIGWRRSLLTGHEFRQTQTALSTYFLQHDGLRLDYPTPVLGKPWSIPLEFPLYQGIVAEIAAANDWPLEPVGRGVALGFFYAALPALALVLGQWGATGPRRWLALAFVLSGPVYLFYSRSFLIESTALCCGLWFLFAFQRYTSAGGVWILLLAVVTGMLASTTKVTTFAVMGVPAAWWLWALLRRKLPVGPIAPILIFWRAGLAATLPLVAGIAWVYYTDQVKAQNPFAGFLRSSAAIDWNFGPLSQRFSGEFWLSILGTTFRSVAAPAVWVLALPFFGAVLREGGWKRPALALACFLAGPLVFANLYAVHDYYFYASGAFLLAGCGLIAGGIIERAPVGRAAGWGVVAAMLAAQFLQFGRVYLPYQRGDDVLEPVEAPILRAVTGPRDVIVVAGRDWNPVLPYLAKRRALMLPLDREAEQPALDRALAALKDEKIGAFLVTGKLRRNTALTAAVIAAGHLAPQPVAEFDGNTLYVPTGAVESARAALRQPDLFCRLPAGALETAPPPAAEPAKPSPASPTSPPPPPAPPPLPSAPPRDPLSMVSPHPTRIALAYDLAAFDVEGVWSVNAHPPSELEFKLPHGATHLSAGFIMSPGSYTGEGNTDGVEFEFVLQNPGEAPVVAFYRYLRPLTVAADRGPQEAEIAIAAKPGAIIFARTKAGPEGHANFDWAFWRRIEIK